MSACSSEKATNGAGASDGFGAGAEPFSDAGSNDGDGENDGGAPPTGPATVRGRVLHGIPNLGLLRVCYAPGYVADDPYTEVDELNLGELESLGLTVSFGSATTYSDVMSRRTGALTFHGPLPPSEDAGALTDEDPSTCARETLEAVLPLPFSEALLGADSESDAGVGDGGTENGLAALSVLPTLESSRPVTLLGSGVALDRAGIDAYAEAAKQGFLADHPRDDEREEGARLAAIRARVQLVTERGPLFVIADEPAVTPEKGAFALHVAHLMADVPGADTRVGELRVCVTEGTVERPVLPVREMPGLRFRVRTLLGGNFAAPPIYRIRFFSRAEFDADDKGCAATSLAPIAQYTAARGTFKSGKSYTLAVVGSAAPTALCSPKESSPWVRAGCAGRDPSAISAQVLLLPDANAN